VRVEEFFPLAAGDVVELSDGGQASLWSEHLTVDEDAGVEIVATHVAPPLRDVPAVTTRPIGSGAAWYVATALDDDSLRRLLGRVIAEAGVVPVWTMRGAGEVDVTRRRRGDATWLFVLNHGSDEVEVEATGHDLVSDEPVDGHITVGAGGCAVVRERA
jgi:beta-galactosidase